MQPKEFYITEKTFYKTRLNVLQQRLVLVGLLRFFIFLITAFGIYFLFDDTLKVFIIGGFGVLIFVWLVIKFGKLQQEKAIAKAKVEINKKEILALQNNFSLFENGEEFKNPNHFFSHDIDLFGERSFFQSINRTKTLQGKSALASLLTSNDTENIVAKQNVIKELATKVKFRQHFTALASLKLIKNKPNSIVDWMLSYKTILPKLLKSIPFLFSCGSLLIISLVIFNKLPFSVLVIWFFLGLFITGLFFKKTNNLYAETNKVSKIFHQYYPLLKQIENENFTSEILLEKQEIINSNSKKASLIFKDFSKILDAFDNRNNIIIALVGNALFLMEINNAIKLEQWIAKYKHVVKQWFEVVAFFDAQHSLANFHFNYPAYTFPVLSDDNKELINAENLGHPLIASSKRVDNDFKIKDANFFIITGANMAGKSTFLRTVSLSIVMVNCGLPVCAKSYIYHPIKLITSMRTSDDLSEEASYFYAELKRLKFIVDEIAKEKYFIILDEILKGTNSKDKAIGSKKFVEKLSASNSTGIIATHDLSLCELEDEFYAIKNYFFEAVIKHDELSFDYQLKQGICKNMNASFLLKKMNII